MADFYDYLRDYWRGSWLKPTTEALGSVGSSFLDQLTRSPLYKTARTIGDITTLPARVATQPLRELAGLDTGYDVDRETYLRSIGVLGDETPSPLEAAGEDIRQLYEEGRTSIPGFRETVFEPAEVGGQAVARGMMARATGRPVEELSPEVEERFAKTPQAALGGVTPEVASAAGGELTEFVGNVAASPEGIAMIATSAKYAAPLRTLRATRQAALAAGDIPTAQAAQQKIVDIYSTASKTDIALGVGEAPGLAAGVVEGAQQVREGIAEGADVRTDPELAAGALQTGLSAAGLYGVGRDVAEIARASRQQPIAQPGAPKVVGTPSDITPDMAAQLKELGWAPEQISQMDPQTAKVTLEQGVLPPPVIEPIPEGEAVPEEVPPSLEPPLEAPEAPVRPITPEEQVLQVAPERPEAPERLVEPEEEIEFKKATRVPPRPPGIATKVRLAGLDLLRQDEQLLREELAELEQEPSANKEQLQWVQGQLADVRADIARHTGRAESPPTPPRKPFFTPGRVPRTSELKAIEAELEAGAGPETKEELARIDRAFERAARVRQPEEVEVIRKKLRDLNYEDEDIAIMDPEEAAFRAEKGISPGISDPYAWEARKRQPELERLISPLTVEREVREHYEAGKLPTIGKKGAGAFNWVYTLPKADKGKWAGMKLVLRVSKGTTESDKWTARFLEGFLVKPVQTDWTIPIIKTFQAPNVEGRAGEHRIDVIPYAESWAEEGLNERQHLDNVVELRLKISSDGYITRDVHQGNVRYYEGKPVVSDLGAVPPKEWGDDMHHIVYRAGREWKVSNEAVRAAQTAKHYPSGRKLRTTSRTLTRAGRKGFSKDLLDWLSPKRGKVGEMTVTTVSYDMEKDGVVDLTGTRVATTRDAALAAMFHRTPFEVWQAIGVKDGKFAQHRMLTSGLADMVAQSAANISAIRRMQALVDSGDLDGFYMIHNHPVTDVTPSQPDISLAKKAIERYPGLLGELVINWDQYSTIDRKGKVKVHRIKERKGIQDPLFGEPLDVIDPNADPEANAHKFANIAMDLWHPDTNILIFHTSITGRIQAVSSILKTDLMKNPPAVRDHIRRVAANVTGDTAYMVFDGPVERPDEMMSRLVDLVSNSTISAAYYGPDMKVLTKTGQVREEVYRVFGGKLGDFKARYLTDVDDFLDDPGSQWLTLHPQFKEARRGDRKKAEAKRRAELREKIRTGKIDVIAKELFDSIPPPAPPQKGAAARQRHVENYDGTVPMPSPPITAKPGGQPDISPNVLKDLGGIPKRMEQDAYKFFLDNNSRMRRATRMTAEEMRDEMARLLETDSAAEIARKLKGKKEKVGEFLVLREYAKERSREAGEAWRKALDTNDPKDIEHSDLLRAEALGWWMLWGDKKTEAARLLKAIDLVQQPEFESEQLLRGKMRAALRRVGVANKNVDLLMDIWMNQPQDFHRALQDHLSPTWLDKLVEWRTAGLLWSPRTHAVNFAGTAAFGLGLREVERTLVPILEAPFVGVAKILGKDVERTRFLSETPYAVIGLKHALLGDETRTGALRQLGRDLKQIGRSLSFIENSRLERGQPTMDITRADEEGRLDIRTTAIKGKKGEFVRTSFKALEAADSFLKALFAGMGMYRHAYRRARGMKAKGSRANLVNKIVKLYSDGHIDLNEVPSQYRDWVAKDLTAVAQDAKGDAFQKDLEGRAKTLQEGFIKHPEYRIVVPFFKTAVNLLGESFKRTPLGFFTALRDYRKRLAKGEVDPEQLGKAMDEFVKPLVGSAISLGLVLAIYQLNEDDDIEILGGGPVEPRAAANWRDKGNIPYSVRLRGKFLGKDEKDYLFEYSRIEPMAAQIGLAADAVEAYKAGELGEVDKAWKKLAHSASENFLSKTWLQNLEGLVTAMHDPGRFLRKYLEDTASSFLPIYGLTRFTAQAIDPVMRREETPLVDAVLADIPGASKFLKPRITATGEERERVFPLAPLRMSKDERDAESRVRGEWHKLGYVPTAPSDEVAIKGEKLRLTEDEEDLLKRVRQATIREIDAQLLSNNLYTDPRRPIKESPTNPYESREEIMKKFIRSREQPYTGLVRDRARARAVRERYGVQ